MPILVEHGMQLDRGVPVPLGGTWINMGRSLRGFRLPEDTLVRLDTEEGIGPEMDLATMRSLFGRSRAMILPPQYPIYLDTSARSTAVQVGTDHPHITEVIGAFLRGHGMCADILPTQTSGRDVIMNFLPRPDGVSIPMAEGQEVEVVTKYPNKHTLLFDLSG